MRKTTTSLLVTLGLALVAAGCGSGDKAETQPTEAPQPEATGPAEPAAPAETADASGDTEKTRPEAGTIPAIPLEAPEPKVEEAWAGYTKHLPFVVGAEKGLAEARKQGKPALLFYAATW